MWYTLNVVAIRLAGVSFVPTWGRGCPHPRQMSRKAQMNILSFNGILMVFIWSLPTAQPMGLYWVQFVKYLLGVNYRQLTAVNGEQSED